MRMRFYVDVGDRMTPEKVGERGLFASTKPGSRIEKFKRYHFDVDVPLPDSTAVPVLGTVELDP